MCDDKGTRKLDSKRPRHEQVHIKMPKVIYKLTGDNEIAIRSRRIVHRFGTAHATVAIHTVNIGDTFARYKGSGIVNAL